MNNYDIKQGDYVKYEYSPNFFIMCRVISIDEKLNKAKITVKSEKGSENEELECTLDKLKSN